MKTLFTLILSAISLVVAFGQQDLILSKYTYNPMFFNPAFAGSHGWYEGTAYLQYRNQWLGVDGSPKTVQAGGEVSLADDRVGVGLTLSSESIGVDRHTDVAGSYAYRIQVGDGILSGGIRAGVVIHRSDFSQIQNVESGDIYDRQTASRQIYSAGIGTYYTQGRFYIGASIPALLSYSSGEKSDIKSRHFYVHIGNRIGNEEDPINIEPSLLIKYQKAAPLQATLGVNMWMFQKFAVGAHWRSDDAVAMSAEVLFDSFRLGAAYDFTYSELKTRTDGTFEVFLGYRFYLKTSTKRAQQKWFGGRF